MKSYTDIEQSKKLAEILPAESADQTWEIIGIAGDNLDVPKYWHNGDTPCIFNSKIGILCWSLAALLDILPSTIRRKEKTMFLTLEKADAYNLYYKSPDRLDELWVTKDDIIDAVVEMILMLHEEKLL